MTKINDGFAGMVEVTLTARIAGDPVVRHVEGHPVVNLRAIQIPLRRKPDGKIVKCAPQEWALDLFDNIALNARRMLSSGDRVLVTGEESFMQHPGRAPRQLRVRQIGLAVPDVVVDEPLPGEVVDDD